MTPRTTRLPEYRHHKPKDLAVVRIGGRDIYLGRYGSEESREKYRRVVAEWLTLTPATCPTRLAATESLAPIIDELILAFWTRFAEQHYRRPDGTATGELDNYRDSLRPLRRLYGHAPVRDFGPLALKAVRQSMIEAGLARSTINQRVGRIVRLFKWAVENELVPSTSYEGLRAVRGLQKGRSMARETGPVRPAPEADIEAIRPFVARQVWAMVQLQRLTGMRPGEVCRMRINDLDTSGVVWTYRPAGHKTEHHGYERVIFIGPRAQEVLGPWLRSDGAANLFSPREAVEERQAKRQTICEATEKGPKGRGVGKMRAPGRPPGECYTPMTYHHAVLYGCKRAGVPAWHPHQLRHNAATWLRREFGVEVARVILGHGRLEATELYAEVDHAKALAIMERVG